MKLYIGLTSLLFLFSIRLNAQDDLAAAALAQHASDHAAGMEFANKAHEAASLNANSSTDQQADIAKQILIIKENQDKAEKMLKEMDAEE